MKSIISSFFLVITLLLSHAVFAGEFNDYCTFSLSEGRLFKTHCLITSEYQGKTYCFGSEASKDSFLENPDAMIQKAKSFYDKKSSMDSSAKDEEGRTKISQEEALKQIKSEHCDLSNRDAGYLELDGLNLSHCNMVNTSFFGAYLRGANLSGADLRHAYLNLARLEGTNLSKANLQDATIFQAIFEHTNFEGANLTNARMIGTLGNVNMKNANIANGRYGLDIGNQPMGAMRFDAVGGNFENSNFENADINRCNLRFANLRNANLKHTNLFRADLSQADLTGADITGTDLNEATLDGTIMTGVKGLEYIKGYSIEKGHCVDCDLKN
jgi:uncharacterized protein YjbI with pentapeptide repeats